MMFESKRNGPMTGLLNETKKMVIDTGAVLGRVLKLKERYVLTRRGRLRLRFLVTPVVFFFAGVAVITEQTGMGASRYKARGILRVPGFESAHVKIEPDGSLVGAISQASIGMKIVQNFVEL